jgi:VanZ family protein
VKIPNFDKLVHFGMYFTLMSVIILENQKTIKTIGRLFLVGILPLSYGILIEFMQSTLTITRSGSIFDALADCIGILVSILLWIWIKPIINK